VALDDCEGWRYTYQALFMSQIRTSGDEAWKYYIGFEGELPSEEDLKTLKLIILSGSGQSAYDTSVPFVAPLKELIRNVYANYPQVKFVGGCFGEQIIAETLGGKVEKMPFDPVREKCLGREWVKPTEEFFEQDFVKKYMAEHNLAKDTLPRIILQESHGDHVVRLPEGATLLAFSDSCNVEVYSIKNRVLCFQSHPDYNCGLQ